MLGPLSSERIGSELYGALPGCAGHAGSDPGSHLRRTAPVRSEPGFMDGPKKRLRAFLNGPSIVGRLPGFFFLLVFFVGEGRRFFAGAFVFRAAWFGTIWSPFALCRPCEFRPRQPPAAVGSGADTSPFLWTGLKSAPALFFTAPPFWAGCRAFFLFKGLEWSEAEPFL